MACAESAALNANVRLRNSCHPEGRFAEGSPDHLEVTRSKALGMTSYIPTSCSTTYPQKLGISFYTTTSVLEAESIYIRFLLRFDVNRL